MLDPRLKQGLADSFGTQIGIRGGESIFVFDWSSLSEDSRSAFVEDNLYAFYQEHAGDSGTRYQPFAVLNPDEDLEEDEMAELDMQCDGVLLLDASSGAVLCCPDATSSSLEQLAGSLEELLATADD